MEYCKKCGAKYRAQELALKRDAELELLEQREMLKIERDLARDCVFQDPDGNLCYEVSFRKRRCCVQVLNVQNLRAECLFCGTEKWIRLLWNVGSESNSAILKENEFTPNSLSKLLIKNGVKFHVSNHKQKDCATALLEYLLRTIVSIEIPAKKGWTKMNDGWFLAEEGDVTADALRG